MSLWTSLTWIAGACILGFVITAVFSSWLHLSRDLFLVPYVGLASAFLAAFFASNAIDVAALLSSNWIRGVVVGVLLATFLVFNVRSQPSSQGPRGAYLVFELMWAGLIYGLIDGLLLSVMPVVAVWEATRQLPWFATLTGTVVMWTLALLAGVAVSVAYHLGYKEFRNERIKFPVIGPGLMTLGVLIGSNPLAAIISHPAMHVAAVIHGPESTIQLPPH